MKVERKDLDALTAELTLTIEKNDYLPEYEKKLKEYQKKAQLKGFRKGKTPFSIVKKMYGAATMQESVSQVLGEKLNEIITGDEYNIIGEPLFLDEGIMTEIDHNMPADYSYRFEIGLEPEFDVKGAGESDKYTRIIPKIDKKLIDEEVDTARKRLGTQKEVDGKIEEGDIVYLNIQEKDGKKIKEGGHSSEFSAPFDSLTKEYQKKLKGKKPGVKLDVKIFEFEENMGRESVIKYLLQIDESKEDAVVPESEVYEAEVLKITRTEQAEMNQDFFDQYFGKDQVSNEDEAREKIEEVLKEHFDREATNLVNREMMHKLVELNKFDLPAEFLKKWITREQEMTDEQLDTFLEELKWRVIKKKLVKQHEIKVEENEILEHFVQMIRNYSPYIDEASLKNTVFSLMKNREQVNKAVEAVSSGKLFDVLRGIVEIKDKEVARDAFNKRVKEINEMAG